MSLINDVLREVERRRGHPSPAGRPSTPLPRRGSRLSILWWIVPAAVAGVALHWVFSESGPIDDSGAPMTASLGEASTPAPIEPVAVETAIPEAVEPLPDPEASPENETTAHAETAHAEPMAEDTREFPAPAESRQPTETSADQAVLPEPAPAQKTIKPQPSESSSSPQRKESNGAIAIEPADGKSASDPDDQLAGARRALARNQFSVAERRVRAILEAEPGHDEARLFLSAALLRRGETGRAARLLEAGLEPSDHPAPLAARLGRILIENGQTARAIEILASHAPQPIDDPDYHQLLAAAHRQAGDHESALTSYRSLTEIVPGRGAVWVGLGASLEALDRPDEAVEAYQRARGTDDRRAARFASQRISALKQANGASR